MSFNNNNDQFDSSNNPTNPSSEYTDNSGLGLGQSTGLGSGTGRQQQQQQSGFNNSGFDQDPQGFQADNSLSSSHADRHRQEFNAGERDTASGNNMGTGVAGSDYGRSGLGDDSFGHTGATGGGLSSGAGARADRDEFDDSYRGDQTTGQKPSAGQKMMGTMEKMVGKATKNPHMQAQGQERKTGNQL